MAPINRTPENHAEATEPGNGLSTDRLMRTLLKLIVTAGGHHPDLARRIRNVALLARRNPNDDSLPGLLDQVVELIIARGRTPAAGDTTSAKLAELLGKQPPVGEYVEQIRFLRSRLRDASTPDEIDRALHELVSLINNLTQRAPKREENPGESSEMAILSVFLDELRMPDDAQPALNSVRERFDRTLTRSAQIEVARLLARTISTFVSPPADSDSAPREDPLVLARDQIHHLIETLTLPPSFSEDKQLLSQQLDAAMKSDEIRQVVQRLVDLLNKARSSSQREINELSGFLKLMTRRMEEFKGQIAKSGEIHDETLASANSLQQEMAEKVADIRELVDEESDLLTLKPAMMDQLVGLESSLDIFVRAEQVRHGDASTQMELVVARLRELESETQRLRSDLEEQHVLTLLDPLTGVLNRLGYTESIGREFERWRRHGGHLSLAMCDLDHFKSINDNYGHAAGDKVLASVAALLRQQIRNCDVLCRMGGEEFAVILTETSVEGAQIAGEKLRASVAGSKFRFKNSPVPVSISVGVAEFGPEDTIEDVYERSDRALYLAKHQGRNRCCSERELDPP